MTHSIKFDDFTSGNKGVVIDSTYMTDIQRKGFYEARDAVADTILAVFEDVEDQTNKTISEYYIGQTSISNESPVKDIPVLSKKWEEHKQHNYGQDGLLVLTAITDKHIPLKHDSCESVVSVKQYTTALHQQLLHLFKIVNKDVRIVNEEFSDNPDEAEDTCTGVIYIVLTLV